VEHQLTQPATSKPNWWQRNWKWFVPLGWPTNARNITARSGPEGKGTIYMSANKLLGQWNYSGLAAEVRQTHQRIDLLQKTVPANSR